MQSVLDSAIERYRRDRFLRAANADFASRKADGKAWKQELHNRELWKKIVADGISKGVNTSSNRSPKSRRMPHGEPMGISERVVTRRAEFRGLASRMRSPIVTQGPLLFKGNDFRKADVKVVV
jgi:hypothetical protein